MNGCRETRNREENLDDQTKIFVIKEDFRG